MDFHDELAREQARQLPEMPEPEDRSLSVPFELRSSGDGLTLAGYAAVFNSKTTIHDWRGEYTESIAPGAFAKAIRANPTPIVQFDHGQHPLIGSLPIAALSRMREDANGLYVEARVFDNWLTQPVQDAIRGGGITGMSFRFSVDKDEWPSDGERILRSVRRVYELGPVVEPAYSATSVALRSLERAVPDISAMFAPPSAPTEEPPAVVENPFAARDAADRARLECLRLFRPPAA